MVQKRFKTRKLGGWLTDLTNVASDAVTGTGHIVLEAGRGSVALATGDFGTVVDKVGSISDTVGQGVSTTYRIASGVFDDASAAKQSINQNVPPGYMVDDKTGEIVPFRVASFQNASRGGASSSSGLWLIAAGIAAKVLFFK